MPFLSLSSGSDEDTSEVSQTLPSTPQKVGENEGEEGELKKQEILVQYLKDTETFALQVEKAISVINSMLYWKTTSGTKWNSPARLSNVFLCCSHNLPVAFLIAVVQEAVQFCVTVCEFSVANSVSGVRKMLPLVWSTDAAIKEAVVQAYRRLYLNPQGDTLRSVKPTCRS